ncbi:uncharacterized protein A1O5_05231, partial [Cladophialophora psammophila CBS 110553]
VACVCSSSRSASGIPTGFRTLLFHVTNPHERKQSGSREGAGPASANLEHINFHLLSAEDVCRQLDVFPAESLSHDDALARIKYGQKHLAAASPTFLGERGGGGNTFLCLRWLLFSAMDCCFIVFFLCWKPLGTPPTGHITSG